MKDESGTKAMDNRQAEKILHDYNKWRRGGKGKTPDPRLVGKAIDEAIVLFRQARNAQNFAKEETARNNNNKLCKL